jgi:hypothetical protein
MSVAAGKVRKTVRTVQGRRGPMACTGGPPLAARPASGSRRQRARSPPDAFFRSAAAITLACRFTRRAAAGGSRACSQRGSTPFVLCAQKPPTTLMHVRRHGERHRASRRPGDDVARPGKPFQRAASAYGIIEVMIEAMIWSDLRTAAGLDADAA